MRRAVPQILVASFLCMVMAGNACAALFEDDEARRAIIDLRQQLEAVKRDSEQRNADEVRRANEVEGQLRRSLIELQSQLEGLQAELAKLRGQNEQAARDVGLTQKELAELQRRLKDSAAEMDERFRKLEPTRVVLDGRDFLADPSEKRDYDGALAIFRKGDFAGAQLAFVDFLNRYGRSGYRPSALFWLGNAQYVTKDYKEAMANFRSLTAQAPDHLRAPEAMLAIANCQMELKEFKAARRTLEELIATHPLAEATATAKERLARLK